MITITQAVEQTVGESPFIEYALANRLLNLSEYARFIKPRVEEVTTKKVAMGAIVIALSRLKQTHKNIALTSSFTVSELSIKSPLCELVFERTEKNLEQLRKTYHEIPVSTNVFLTVTQSSTEIMLTLNQQLKEKVLELFDGSNPKVILENLVGISIRLSDEDITHPNVFYNVLKGLAWSGVNLVDLVSTYSELIIIVNKENMEKAFSVMNDFYIGKSV